MREYVPAIMEELHTIADLRDPDQIRRDIEACATRWQLDKLWITRTMHRTVRFWHYSPIMRASRQWAPVLPENGWESRRSWRRRKAIQYRGFKPTPTSKIQEAELFHGLVRHDMLHEGYGTIAGNPTRQAAAVSRLCCVLCAKALEQKERSWHKVACRSRPTHKGVTP